MGKGQGDFLEAAVTVDRGGKGRRPEAGRQLGADLQFVGEIEPRGETDDGLTLMEPDGERRRLDCAKSDGVVGAYF